MICFLFMIISLIIYIVGVCNEIKNNDGWKKNSIAVYTGILLFLWMILIAIWTS